MLSAVVYADDASNPQAVDTTPKQATDGKTLGENFNGGIKFLNGKIATVMFFDVSFGAFKKPKKTDAGEDMTDENGEPVMEGPEVGFTIIFLAAGAVFFTFWYGFIYCLGECLSGFVLVKKLFTHKEHSYTEPVARYVLMMSITWADLLTILNGIAT